MSLAPSPPGPSCGARPPRGRSRGQPDAAPVQLGRAAARPCSPGSLAGGLELIRRVLVTPRGAHRERSEQRAQVPVPVARKMVLQVAVRDIGQLTDIRRAL